MTYNLENLNVTEGHKALAAFIKRETGKVVKPESVALVLVLQAEFRKDPEQVAKRDAVKAEARRKKEVALQKALDKARALAESLGLEVPTVEAPVEDEAEPEEAADEVEAEEVATVTPISAAKSKGRQIMEANDFGADTSAIDVVEEADGFTVDSTEPEEEDF